MGSLLEGFIGMMCVAAVGGIVAGIVHTTESPIALTCFAFLGSHVLAAGMLTVSFSIVCDLAKRDPPFPFLWSMLLLVVIPAVISLSLAVNFYWPDPSSRLTRAASRFGAVASPFLLLGIGGTVIESWMTRARRDKTKQ